MTSSLKTDSAILRELDTAQQTVDRELQTDRWSYREAFCRNLGLINEQEQEKLRNTRVAIAGMGGVGGIHLATLARLGIGKFTIADPDTFELANMNRQYGARMDTLGRSKAEVMAEEARRINPDVDLRIFTEPVGPENAEQFLDGVDLLVDGIEFFAIAVRRLLFGLAAKKGIYTVTAGPMGFGTAWLVFDPNGMSFDRYFDLRDEQSRIEQVASFAVGVTPALLQRPYIDLSKVSLTEEYGPSVGFACQLCAGVAAAEAMKILLSRGKIRCAPAYWHFDPYRGLLKKGVLRGGNRHPLQRLKRWWLLRKFA